MAVNAHLAAVRGAERSSRELARLFGRLGTVEHPRGRILAAYRNARRGLRDVFGRGVTWSLQVEVGEVLNGLRSEVRGVAVELLMAAYDLGAEQGERGLAARGVGPSGGGARVRNLGPAMEAWVGVVNQQAAAAGAVAAAGGEVELIVGDESRGGILQPGPVVREGARWLTAAMVQGWWGAVGGSVQPGPGWYKQAIAAIDERTTDCCLRVHGQAVPMVDKFKLRGEPRYADEQEWSPFHWYCRTSIALVTADEIEDELTRRMREAAEAEIARRAAIQAQIDEVKAKLVALGAAPDIRHRQGDSERVTVLRDELRWLYEELNREQHPASGV